MKNYDKLIKQLDKLMQKKIRIWKSMYNLSGSGWQDSFTPIERNALYISNAYKQDKMELIDKSIVDILYALQLAGYDINSIVEGIINKYSDKVYGSTVFDILSLNYQPSEESKKTL